MRRTAAWVVASSCIVTGLALVRWLLGVDVWRFVVLLCLASVGATLSLLIQSVCEAAYHDWITPTYQDRLAHGTHQQAQAAQKRAN